MQDNSGIIVATIATIIILSVGFFMEKYKFQDCKKVGHTTMYCVLDMII